MGFAFDRGHSGKLAGHEVGMHDNHNRWWESGHIGEGPKISYVFEQ